MANNIYEVRQFEYRLREKDGGQEKRKGKEEGEEKGKGG